MENPKGNYMEFYGGGLGSFNMIETKFSKHLWIDGWLDYHQNQKMCGIIGKDDAQTPNNKIVSIQSHYVILKNICNVYM